MDCKKCGFKLVDGQDICPRCGASQKGDDTASQGVSMELPPMENEPVGEEKKKKASPAKKKTGEAKKAVKETAQKAKQTAKKAADKVKEVSKEAAENVSDAAKEVADATKKGSKKTWLYVLIGVAAAVVLIIVGYLVVSYQPKNGEELQSVVMATSEDTVYIVEGDTLTEIAEIPDGLNARDILTAIDGKNFYLIDDAENDEDSGEYLGDLIYLKSNGKGDEIDSDVIAGSVEIIGGVVWYEKADKDEVIVCCYDGRNAIEVIEEEGLSDWAGTDKAGKAYYTLIDEDDFTSEVFVIENGDEESIMDEAQIVTVSADFKKVMLVTQDDGEATVYIFDGKDDFEVMDDVQDVLINNETFDMILVADADDMVLYYVPYNKEAIEIDDEVQEILMVPNLYSQYITNDLGSMIYYGKDDDLYAADFRGKDSERVLKNYDELDIISQPTGSKEIVYVDDEEVVWINIDTLKETSVELPDSNELRSYDVVLVGGWYVYRTEDNKELFAFDGRRNPIELSDDADEIMDFSGFMDTYVVWLNIDGELIASQLKEDSAEEIGDDVYEYWLTDDGEVYFLSDFEDGEGDLYYTPRVNKDAERIEKDITNLFRLYYE